MEEIVIPEIDWKNIVAKKIVKMTNDGESDEDISALIADLPEEQQGFARTIYDKRRGVADIARKSKIIVKDMTIHGHYYRAGTFDVKFLSDYVKNHNLSVCGVRAKGIGWKMRIYLTKGVKCAFCGREGKFVAIESEKNSTTPKFRFHVYSVDEDGTETMITIDHIIPRAKGGKDRVENAQPLCYDCNSKKGDKIL